MLYSIQIPLKKAVIRKNLILIRINAIKILSCYMC